VGHICSKCKGISDTNPRKMKHKCFEDFLYEQHAKQYTGIDDAMPDDWGEWVADLDPNELIQYADMWMKEERLAEL